MPIYEYVCEDCGHAFEYLVMGSDKPVCPSCESTELDKRFSTFAPSSGRSAPPDCGYPSGGG